jgi:hypothetical protein
MKCELQCNHHCHKEDDRNNPQGQNIEYEQPAKYYIQICIFQCVLLRHDKDGIMGGISDAAIRSR